MSHGNNEASDVIQEKGTYHMGTMKARCNIRKGHLCHMGTMKPQM